MAKEKTDVKIWKLKNNWTNGNRVNRPENLETKIGNEKSRKAW